MQPAPHGSVKIEVTADDVETMRGITLDNWATLRADSD